MKFGKVPVDESVGAILAHGVRTDGRAFKKGTVLSAEDAAILTAGDIRWVTVVRLEADDVGEDEAAAGIAAALGGRGVSVGAAATGRANLFAEVRGVVDFDRRRLDALNMVDEAVAVATVAPYDLVEPGQMVATVKIIPFAVRTPILEA